MAFDRVVIETTGLADPGPVTQSFFTDPLVARCYLLDAVITIVDAKHGHETLDQHPEAQRQVGFADRMLLSKSDLVSTEEVTSLRARLIRMNPRAAIREAHMGQVPLAEIFDLRGFNLSAILEIDPGFLSGDHQEHDPHEPAVDLKPHAHDDDIRAFVYQSDRPFNPIQLRATLDALAERYGPNMLRYKGVLYVAGERRRAILQGVHAVIGLGFGRRWATDETPMSTMVFIGRDLPQGAFRQGLAACLVQ
jgi:G3E family GTPase